MIFKSGLQKRSKKNIGPRLLRNSLTSHPISCQHREAC